MSLILSLADVQQVVSVAEKEPMLAIDVETTGLDSLSDSLIGVSVATKTDAWYVDFLLLEANSVDPRKAMAILEPLFDTQTRILVAHNALFEYVWLSAYYGHDPFHTDANLWDTMALAALNDENLIGVSIDFEDASDGGKPKKVGCLGLKALSRIYLGREQRLYEEDFPTWAAEERAEYGTADARNCYDLALRLRRALISKGLWEYYLQCVVPLTFITAGMEQRGVCVDTEKLQRVQQEIESAREAVVEQLKRIVPPSRVIKFVAPTGKDKTVLAEQLIALGHTLPMTSSGKSSITADVLKSVYESDPTCVLLRPYMTTVEVPFNPNSTQQLGAYLMSKRYHMPLTETGKPRTDEEALTALAQKYPTDPVWAPLTKLRVLTKLLGTYVTGLLEVVWEDGRCHPQWNYVGTVTGRFSSRVSNKKQLHPRGPAFQTIPRADTIVEEGWEWNPREWFVAGPGNVLVVADLSQAEVRMLAVMSGDNDLCSALEEGSDIHSAIAEKIYKERWEKASKEERVVLRRNAKTATFGTIYGIGPTSLSSQLHITETEAQQLLDDFYGTFQGVQSWKQGIRQDLLRFGYTKTYLGRRRTPVLLKPAPRVTAPEETAEYDRQRLAFLWWKHAWLAACYKSHFDPEDVDTKQLEGRAVRQGVNFTIQGSVAEMTNYGMQLLHQKGWKIVAQVHDEILIEVEDNPTKIQQVVSDIYKTFEKRIPVYLDATRSVPFKVDVGVGHSWAVKH